MIRKARIEKGYTQEMTARSIDVSLRHYVVMENYKHVPNVVTAIRLANFLNKPIEELFKPLLNPPEKIDNFSSNHPQHHPNVI